MNFKGIVEIIGKKGDEVIYYDKGENLVTKWAKHAIMHALTGESFSSHGVQRSMTPADHESGIAPGQGVNIDGTLLSGEQYFSNNESPNYGIEDRWSKSTAVEEQSKGDAGDLVYPFFPTKMLFGTGKEFKDFDELPEIFKDYYSDWDESIFNLHIASTNNNYSDRYDEASGELFKTRTMNDITPGTLTDVIEEDDFAISGAIKHGFYEDTSLHFDKMESIGGKEFLKTEWNGVGNPCYIYSNREARFFENGAQVMLNSDSDTENKITFTVVMPEQTGANAGIFYPYNGYYIKQVGLFCDARLVSGNSPPVFGDNFYPPYVRMPSGIMIAKRNITPFYKSHDSSLTIRWTIYI